MPPIRFPISHLALAASLVLAACSGTPEKEKAAAPEPTAPTASAAPKLDESQLPPVLRRLHADWLRSQERNPDPR